MGDIALLVLDMMNPYAHDDADQLAASVVQTVEPLAALVKEAHDRPEVDLIYVKDNHGDFTASPEALYPGMPEAVTRLVRADHTLPAAALGAMLGQRCGEPVQLAGTPPPSELETREADIARLGGQGVSNDLAEFGELGGFACPDCDGGLLHIRKTERFRCRVGHAWTAEALLDAQHDCTERALWTAYRMLNERAEMAARLEKLARDRNSASMVRRHVANGREAREAAEVPRALLLAQLPEPGRVADPAT